jgi:hypothetical protein
VSGVTRGSPDDGDLAAAMAKAALALKDTETVEQAWRGWCWCSVDHPRGGTLRHLGHRRSVSTMAFTDGMVDRLDQLQYTLGEGPCLDAMHHHTSVVVDDMRTETRWPRFAPQAPACGCISQMGIEIFRESGRVGGLNLCSSQPRAFDECTRQAATLLAIHTSVVMAS